MKRAKLFGLGLFGILMLSYTITSAKPIIKPYFSFKDDLRARFIELIDSANKTIYGAIYEFTDNRIAKSLVTAKQRGVDVRIIIDECKYNKNQVQVLLDNKISVFMFDNKYHNTWAAKMHDKYAAIDGKIVATGSYNWTISASNKNQENLLIIYDKNTCKDYQYDFWRLRKLSMPMGDFKDALDINPLDSDDCCCGCFNWIHRCFKGNVDAKE